MNIEYRSDLTQVIGAIPYRMALAGGWIDQPFVSRLNPDPVGSMVVVGLQPTMRFMERAGMATGTRKVAHGLWQGSLPDRNLADLVRELYREENKGLADPSGSQDMIGLVCPGINRLDYSAHHEDGYFPQKMETVRDPAIAQWLETILHVIPVMQRPNGYHPLAEKRLEPAWIQRLGQSGRQCFEAIVRRDMSALGASLNECMACWEYLLPHTVRHPTIKVDLVALLRYYQSHYPGAMYSGCGGGYLFVVSDQPVPGSFKIQIRL